MSAKKHERTDRRSADLLITVSKLYDEIRVPPHNKKNWTSTTRSYIFSSEHEKFAARAQVLLEPRGQRHNTDSHSNAVDVQIGRSCFYRNLHRQTVDFRALFDCNILPHVSIFIYSVCLIDHGRLTVYLRDFAFTPLDARMPVPLFMSNGPCCASPRGLIIQSSAPSNCYLV